MPTALTWRLGLNTAVLWWRGDLATLWIHKQHNLAMFFHQNPVRRWLMICSYPSAAVESVRSVWELCLWPASALRRRRAFRNDRRWVQTQTQRDENPHTLSGVCGRRRLPGWYHLFSTGGTNVNQLLWNSLGVKRLKTFLTIIHFSFFFPITSSFPVWKTWGRLGKAGLQKIGLCKCKMCYCQKTTTKERQERQKMMSAVFITSTPSSNLGAGHHSHLYRSPPYDEGSRLVNLKQKHLEPRWSANPHGDKRHVFGVGWPSPWRWEEPVPQQKRFSHSKMINAVCAGKQKKKNTRTGKYSHVKKLEQFMKAWNFLNTFGH